MLQSEPSVLVIEDEYLVAIDLAEQLEELGHKCHLEVTIEDALAYLDMARPRFAFLDHQMWQVETGAVAERLIELGIPFCVCSALRIEDRIGVFSARPTLLKPYHPDKLAQVLRALDPPQQIAAEETLDGPAPLDA